jgi:acetylornithine deacetylase/succinyl-diaminopimelate desuccinylase-like protein
MSSRQRDAATGETAELLQGLIRNRCVNDGTPGSGDEYRNADTIAAYLGTAGLDIERFEPAPGRTSIVARIAGNDANAPSLCLLSHSDVVPADEDAWTRDPFGGELVDGEVWGRGAIDMLNLTASMAVAVRRLASTGFRPRGDLIYVAAADEEAGSALGAGWLMEHQREHVRADYVLTETGGWHVSDRRAPVVAINVAEKGVAWRRLRVRGTPGHGSRPFRADNALVRAAAVIQRLDAYRPRPRFHELWPQVVAGLPVEESDRAALLDPDRLDDALEAWPDASTAAHLHACTHTTFSCNAVSGRMKTNVIPGVVDIELDIRTLAGETDEDVRAHLDSALGDLAAHVDVEPILDGSASISPTDTALWDALAGAVGTLLPGARIAPNLMIGFTDARVYREAGAVAYGAGLFAPDVDPGELSRRFHGTDERVDVESLGLTTSLWGEVATRLLT